MAENSLVKKGYFDHEVSAYQGGGYAGGMHLDAKQVIVEDTDHEHERLQENMRDVITKDSHVFVKIEAYGNAFDCLATKNHVTLLGSRGCGKTAMGYQFLREYKKCNFDVLIVDTPSDLKHDRDPERPTIVLVDDVFGKDDSPSDCSYKWQYALEHELCPLVGYGSKQKSNMKLIFTSQSKCFEDTVGDLAYLRETIFSENTVFDVTFLTENDKKNIIKRHHKKSKVDIDGRMLRELCSVKTPLGFPRTCQLLFMKACCPDPVAFFQNPLKSFALQ